MANSRVTSMSEKSEDTDSTSIFFSSISENAVLAVVINIWKIKASLTI